MRSHALQCYQRGEVVSTLASYSLAETTFYLLSYLELTSDLQPRQLGQTLLAHPLTVLEKESSELHQC